MYIFYIFLKKYLYFLVKKQRNIFPRFFIYFPYNQIIKSMKILSDQHIEMYKKTLWDFDIHREHFLQHSQEVSFEYLTESSSVYSSNIEWNTIDLNSFMNIKGKWLQTKDVKEIEDLIWAYGYAQENTCNEENMRIVHKLLSNTFLIWSNQWKYRNDKIGVFWKEWLIYLAIEAENVPEKMNQLFCDIDTLLGQDMTVLDVFYYAAYIHLVFAHIHPFHDGNGRSARLLEKWFITMKLWREYWKIPSEELYKINRSEYYKNLNLWVNYYELDYEKALPFLLLLPKSFNL